MWGKETRFGGCQLPECSIRCVDTGRVRSLRGDGAGGRAGWSQALAVPGDGFASAGTVGCGRAPATAVAVRPGHAMAAEARSSSRGEDARRRQRGVAADEKPSAARQHRPRCRVVGSTGRTSRSGAGQLRAGRQHARLRFLHDRDARAAADLRPLLHFARDPPARVHRLHSQPARLLGNPAGSQPRHAAGRAWAANSGC